MSGILGYLSILADDISSLAGKSMATTSKSLATTFDDMGVLFDDIATYTKLASSKSSGLLIDDLAAISSFTNETTSDILKKELEKASNIKEFKNNIENLEEKSKKELLSELEKIRDEAIKVAQKNAAKRELPIVYKIALGSLKNKFIIIPIVLILNFFAPWLIAPALILGGIYLAYEGVETVLEKLHNHKEEIKEEKQTSKLSSQEFEAQKVKSAIKTDFILSFEIIVIALSILSQSEFSVKLTVLIIVGILTTVVVYGIVALIIKLDDIGFYLQEKKSLLMKKIGNSLVLSMPVIIKIISIIGTVAMLAVGGSIVAHQTHALTFLEEFINSSLGNFSSFLFFIVEILFGVIIGFIALKVIDFVKPILKK
ncbi:hypothetical protein CRV08_07980 [Halarcobacter ebronensis]|uniref:DUF808 domain-containing protein n=1 Tax=Halarcobacter ebronensis TaxID=1462615 RepID=A0A4Q0YDU2_9BACT|nr:DUF808 family protein [Halarcobacter ebronensis]RXJ68185.1 hypothetical protein CRV08_07980 [Halarcobacter ebronensis]